MQDEHGFCRQRGGSSASGSWRWSAVADMRRHPPAPWYEGGSPRNGAPGGLSPRQALGGSKLASVESLAVSGHAANGSIQSDMTLSIQLPGKFMREQTAVLLGGSIPGVRADVSPEMMAQVGQPTVIDCLNGERQWSDIRMSADSQIGGEMVERAAGSFLVMTASILS